MTSQKIFVIFIIGQVTMTRLKMKTINGLKCSFIFTIFFLITFVLITHLSKASVYGIFNIFTVDFHAGLYHDRSERGLINSSDENHLVLDDFTRRESQLLSKQLKIFFVQTSENEDLLSRHACSIESAARLHPTGLIFVFMRSRLIDRKKNVWIRLQTYSNIYFVHFNEQDIYSGTTLARLNHNERRQFIHYFTISHMSDFIRTVLLYKYGGIYFDLDVIPLRTFMTFSNTVGLESNDGVNVAVLVMEKQHLVLDIQMDLQLKSINSPLQAFCWSCVGPSALSDALKHICDEHTLHIHAKDRCHQIDIQPSYVFYPIPYQQIPRFFRQSESSNEIDDLIKNSSIYSIHYFHHMTMNLPIERFSPFARVAEEFCPRIFDELIDRNEFHVKSTIKSQYFITNINLLFLCLTISFFAISILLLTGVFLTYFTSLRLLILTLQHKFHLFI